MKTKGSMLITLTLVATLGTLVIDAKYVAPFLVEDMETKEEIKSERRSEPFSGQNLDCTVFCKKTGFGGRFGGCNCGFSLFNKRHDR